MKVGELVTTIILSKSAEKPPSSLMSGSFSITSFITTSFSLIEFTISPGVTSGLKPVNVIIIPVEAPP